MFPRLQRGSTNTREDWGRAMMLQWWGLGWARKWKEPTWIQQCLCKHNDFFFRMTHLFFQIFGTQDFVINNSKVSPQDDNFKEILSVIRYTASASDRFWRTLYSCGVWIPRKLGTELVNDGWQMTDTSLLHTTNFVWFPF